MRSLTIQLNRRAYRDWMRGLVVGLTLGATVAAADTLVARGHSYEGAFTTRTFHDQEPPTVQQSLDAFPLTIPEIGIRLAKRSS